MSIHNVQKGIEKEVVFKKYCFGYDNTIMIILQAFIGVNSQCTPCASSIFFKIIMLTLSITVNSISDAFPAVVIYYFSYSIRYELSPTDNKCPHCYSDYGTESLISLLQHSSITLFI
jgi:hypothetical protein